MISSYNLGDEEIILSSDLAAEFPIYLYLSEDRDKLFYSQSIKELLNDKRIPKPLGVSFEGLSFLLQSGVVPPPKTIYQNIFVIGIGVTATIMTVDNEIHIDFSYNFPFLNANRAQEGEVEPDEDYILQLLAEATISRIVPGKPTFLFHSAGKDSNMIALALAEAGLQDRVTLISHKSKGESDESEISKSIAKKLGFKHQLLYEDTKFIDLELFRLFFEQTTLPVLDTVTLAYPLYLSQFPHLKNSNLIDGGGNDVYMGTPPTKRDNLFFRTGFLLEALRPLRKLFPNSELVLNHLTRNKAEWCSFVGFTFEDVNKFFPKGENLSLYFRKLVKKRQQLDSFDFKTDIYATIVIAEMHIRKFRNAAEILSSNSILPFANEKIVNYFFNLPEHFIFDRITLKNKLIFRKILKRRIGLDSDTLGKMGYSFDYWSILLKLDKKIEEEITQCLLWDRAAIELILSRLRKKQSHNQRARALIQRLYLISAWYNHNIYVNNHV